MNTSVWGIDHGEPVFKNDNRGRTAGLIAGAGKVLTPATPVLSAGAAGAYGASQARQGRKAAVGGRVGGRSFAQGVGAGAGAGLLGRAVGGARGGALGTAVGGAVGAAHGASAAMRNARSRGDLKPVAKNDDQANRRYEDRSRAYTVGGTAAGAATGAAYAPALRARQSAGAGYRLSRGMGSGRVRATSSAVRAAGAGARGGKVGRVATGVGALGGLYTGSAVAGAKNLHEENRRRRGK